MNTSARLNAMTIGITLLNLACIMQARSDDSASSQKAPAVRTGTYTGIITAVDDREKIICVKAVGFTRAFNVAGNCQLSLENKPHVTLEAFHPGQRVQVTYQDAHGVLVAQQVDQMNIVLSGYITKIDAANHKLVVKHGLFNHAFTIGDGCAVVLKDDQRGNLNELKIGHTVQVIYEQKHGGHVACQIDQKYATFSGTIRAIDAEMKTVRAKNLMNDMKFNLANGCRIVIGDQREGNLRDLRIGDQAVFSYENNNGVLLASRIGIGSASAAPESRSTR